MTGAVLAVVIVAIVWLRIGGSVGALVNLRVPQDGKGKVIPVLN
jgi:hypothetical protein